MPAQITWISNEVKRNGATLATYQYGDQGLLAEYDPAGTLTRAYGWPPQGLWGTDPVFLAEVAHSGGNTYWTVHYYHTDHLGTPQALTDQAGE